MFARLVVASIVNRMIARNPVVRIISWVCGVYLAWPTLAIEQAIADCLAVREHHFKYYKSPGRVI